MAERRHIEYSWEPNIKRMDNTAITCISQDNFSHEIAESRSRLESQARLLVEIGDYFSKR
jgi:hypothetical protein